MKTLELLATVSAASSRTSLPMDLEDLAMYSIQVTISGSDVAGTLKLQCSDDNTTYFDVANSSVSITSSADQLWDVTICSYRYVKAVWTASSGTGNITIIGFLKAPIVAFN